MVHTMKNDNWLAEWSFDAKEWYRFEHWLFWKRGILRKLFSLLNPFRKQAHAKVRISSDAVWINKEQLLFCSPSSRYLGAEIFNAGKLNVMEILYRKGKEIAVISIPVPKGKLKEAIILESLLRKLNTV